MIEMAQVEKWYGDFHALKGVSLSVGHGEILALIGPSGGGKSTVMRVLARLENFQAGSIRIGGEMLPVDGPVRRGTAGKVGVVFQGIHLFPHLSVLENVTLAPIRAGKMAADDARKLARELLEQVGVADQSDKFPAALSGGQQQRVAIARALATRPDILVLDEPTSALDPERVAETARLIKALAKKGDLTALVITHELAFAREVADRIAFLEEGQILEIFQAGQAPSHPRIVGYLKGMLQGFGAPSV